MQSGSQGGQGEPFKQRKQLFGKAESRDFAALIFSLAVMLPQGSGLQTPSEASPLSARPTPEASPHWPLLPRWCCRHPMPGWELRKQEGDTPPQHQLLLSRSVLNSVCCLHNGKSNLQTLLIRCSSKG